MSGGTAVEERRVGVVNNLVEGEVLVMSARSERLVGSLVAKLKLRRLGDGVVVSPPYETDGVANRGVDSERNVTENTLCRSDDNGVGRART